MNVDVVYGFLGCGKTTFIKNILQYWGKEEQIVVLVNEFGDVGIDGEMLQDQNGNIVEMPSGCICCTLQPEFRMQLWELCQNIKPDRVIIEPTGVAVISQIGMITNAEIFQDAIQSVHNVFIADTASFMDIYKSNRHFVETQISKANLALLNKCDLVGGKKAQLLKGSITAINPDISVLMSEYGIVDWAEYQASLKGTFQDSGGKSFSTNKVLPLLRKNSSSCDCSEIFGNHAHNKLNFHPEEDALGYESIGLVFDKTTFIKPQLENFFQELTGTSMGQEIVRAKGIFRVNTGFIIMEMASGQLDSQPVKKASQSKISIIGKGLKRGTIEKKLNECIQNSV